MYIFSMKRALREPRITMALLYKTHRVDPKSAVVYSCIAQIRDFLRRNEPQKAIAMNIWRELHENFVTGPMAAIKECFEYLGWSCSPDFPWSVVRTDDVPLNWLTLHGTLFFHELRRSLRWKLVHDISPLRPDFCGIQGRHLSYYASTQLLRGGVPVNSTHFGLMLSFMLEAPSPPSDEATSLLWWLARSELGIDSGRLAWFSLAHALAVNSPVRPPCIA
jgi:hypothetical protein